MGVVVLGVGLVLVVEGFVLALAPGRVEDVLDLIRRMPTDPRRVIGLCAVAVGTALIWLIRSGPV